METKLSPSTVKVGDVLTGGRAVTNVWSETFVYDNVHGGASMAWAEANDLGFQVEKKEEDWEENFELQFSEVVEEYPDGSTLRRAPNPEIKSFIKELLAQERAEIKRKARLSQREIAPIEQLEGLPALTSGNVQREVDIIYNQALDDLIKVL